MFIVLFRFANTHDIDTDLFRPEPMFLVLKPLYKAPHPLNLLAPLVMIELRQVGYVEVNGPDVDGLHKKIESFVTSVWSLVVRWIGPSLKEYWDDV